MKAEPVNKRLTDIIFHYQPAASDSEEFRFGFSEMQQRLPSSWRCYYIDCTLLTAVADVIAVSQAESMLVILNPALILSDNLAEGLAFADMALPQEIDCLLPHDPRSVGPEFAPDYATRPGFDRYVRRLARLPRLGSYDGREPWVFAVKRSAVEQLLAEQPRLTWPEVPVLLGERTRVVQSVFVHSYADYYLNDRAEMLNLLPDQVASLLDIGGGEGNFAAAFASRSNGQATLAEQNPVAAARARERGLRVVEGDFLTAHFPQRYDCVAMLDVLEHMVDPLKVLQKARSLLTPTGCLLLSVPNVGHWAVVSDLLAGRFDYQPVGILCNTHLRFFTAHSLQAFLQKAGFTIVQWHSVGSQLPAEIRQYLVSNVPTWLTPDTESLATESFHVLATAQSAVAEAMSHCYGGS